jgi:drug/metabolite transporter, DME family
VAAAGEPAARGDAVGGAPRRQPAVGAALVLGAASLWATFGIFAKHLYAAGLTPLELASVRATIGFLAVAAFSARRLAGPTGILRAGRDALPFFVAYGVLGYALFTVVFLGSLERTPVSIAVALLYTAPAFVVGMSALLWHERVSASRLVALGMVLTGVLLVTGAAGALLRGTASLGPVALGYGLGAGLTYAVYTIFSKLAAERFGAAAALFWSFAFAALALALLAPPWAPFLRAPGQWPLLIGLGVVPTLIPYSLYLAALRALRASSASMLASIEPVVAAILAALLLGERLELLQAAGMLLVVAAAVMLARQAAGEPPAGSGTDSTR